MSTNTKVKFLAPSRCIISLLAGSTAGAKLRQQQTKEKAMVSSCQRSRFTNTILLANFNNESKNPKFGDTIKENFEEIPLKHEWVTLVISLNPTLHELWQIHSKDDTIVHVSK